MATRSWAGTRLADRRAERRRRLLDAGLDLLGTQGSAAVSVRSACRAAGLTDRYFYENFADREALVVAVFDEVADEAERALVGVVAQLGCEDYERVAEAAVEAFLDVLTADPRKGRVLLLEPLGDPALGARSRAVSSGFAAIIGSQFADPDEFGAQLTATALVGAMANLFLRWLAGDPPFDRSVIAGYCVRLLVTSTAPASTPAAGRVRPRES